MIERYGQRKVENRLGGNEAEFRAWLAENECPPDIAGRIIESRAGRKVTAPVKPAVTPPVEPDALLTARMNATLQL